MPKVTLLRDEWSDYMLVVGTNTIRFVGKKPKEVSPAVAIACEKRNEGLRKPLFRIEDMPDVVERKSVQNVRGIPRQPVMVAEKWL